jgi:1-aminocyclopropane-1-carboxylate deaminase
MQEINLSNITIDRINSPAATNRGITMDVLRLDKIHPLVSGNKWFKLRYYLDEAIATNKTTIVTYGGAWSNHILATAAACQQNNLKCIGIIRGEEPATYSHVLKQASGLGMQFLFISRGDFTSFKLPPALNHANYYVIPQGGYGIKGMEGATTILDLVARGVYTDICCAVGTGTMLAGLLHAATKDQMITGISVLKNNFQLEENITRLSGETVATFNISHDHHFGGYAKYTTELIRFMNEWYKETGIPTDFVYTGKLCYAVLDMIQKGSFTDQSRILLIHSGGLTGNNSLPKGTLIF